MGILKTIGSTALRTIVAIVVRLAIYAAIGFGIYYALKPQVWNFMHEKNNLPQSFTVQDAGKALPYASPYYAESESYFQKYGVKLNPSAQTPKPSLTQLPNPIPTFK